MQRRQPRFIERQLARCQGVNAGSVHVDAQHIEAELSHAGGMCGTEIAGAEHSEASCHCTHPFVAGRA
jgi:hypothetical protein